jgi:MFS family permease
VRAFSSSQNNLNILERSAFFQGFSFFFLDFYLQVLGVSLGASSIQIGAFTGTVFAAQIFANPLAGYLVEKIGAGRTLALGSFARVVSLIVVGVAIDLSSASLITIGRAFQGLAAGFFWTASPTIIADETEKGGRSNQFGRLTLWVNRGMLLGALGGIGLLVLRLDLPPFFFAIAAAISGIYGLKIKKPTAPITQPNKILDPNNARPNNRKAGIGLVIIYFFNALGLLAITSFLTVYVTQTVLSSSTVNESAILIGLSLSPYLVALSLIAPRLTRIADRQGHLSILTVSLLAFLPVCLSLILIQQLWELSVLALALNLTNAIFGSSANAVVGNVYKSKRGSAYGWLNTAEAIGASSGAFLGGILYPLGWQTLIQASVLIQAVALTGIIFLRQNSNTTRTAKN